MWGNFFGIGIQQSNIIKGEALIPDYQFFDAGERLFSKKKLLTKINFSGD